MAGLARPVCKKNMTASPCTSLVVDVRCSVEPGHKDSRFVGWIYCGGSGGGLGRALDGHISYDLEVVLFVLFIHRRTIEQ